MANAPIYDAYEFLSFVYAYICLILMSRLVLYSFFLSFNSERLWYVSLYSIDVQTFVEMSSLLTMNGRNDTHSEYFKHTSQIICMACIKASFYHALLPKKIEEKKTWHKTFLLHLAKFSCRLILFLYFSTWRGSWTLHFLNNNNKSNNCEYEQKEFGLKISICLTTYSTSNSVNKHCYCAACRCCW